MEDKEERKRKKKREEESETKTVRGLYVCTSPDCTNNSTTNYVEYEGRKCLCADPEYIKEYHLHGYKGDTKEQ